MSNEELYSEWLRAYQELKNELPLEEDQPEALNEPTPPVERALDLPTLVRESLITHASPLFVCHNNPSLATAYLREATQQLMNDPYSYVKVITNDISSWQDFPHKPGDDRIVYQLAPREEARQLDADQLIYDLYGTLLDIHTYSPTYLLIDDLDHAANLLVVQARQCLAAAMRTIPHTRLSNLYIIAASINLPLQPELDANLINSFDNSHFFVLD